MNTPAETPKPEWLKELKETNTTQAIYLLCLRAEQMAKADASLQEDFAKLQTKAEIKLEKLIPKT